MQFCPASTSGADDDADILGKRRHGYRRDAAGLLASDAPDRIR